VISTTGHGSVADLLAAVGRGDMRAHDVVTAVYPDYRDDRLQTAPVAGEEGWFDLEAGSGMKFRVPEARGAADEDDGAALPISGLAGDLPVSFAPNGGAVPGDRIVGILTPGVGVTIYPIQSPALQAFEEETDRWLDVRWDMSGDSHERFPARIVIAALNEPGSLATIAGTIADLDGNIDNLKMLKRAADFHQILIDLEVWDLKHLTRIMNQLRAKPNVSSVTREIG
jgi:guanosine-3',5'-bis(diphosphate) 3'-pyrophosphohydrolase